MEEFNQRKDQDKGNYLAQLLAALECANLPSGTVHHAHVEHDDWCRLLKGKGECNCNPTVLLQEELPL
jgi:hypothetical protein